MKSNTQLKLLTGAALFALAALPIAATAQDRPRGECPGGSPHARMLEADTDGDGNISQAEAAARHAARFAEMDANGDGVISPDERPAHRRGEARGPGGGPGEGRGHGPGHGPGGRLLQMDADGDGAVTRAEFQAAHDAMWERLDTNGDGVIDDGDDRPEPPRDGQGPRGPATR